MGIQEIEKKVKEKMGSEYPEDFVFELKHGSAFFYFKKFPEKHSVFNKRGKTKKEDIDAIVKRVYLMKEMRLKWN